MSLLSYSIPTLPALFTVVSPVFLLGITTFIAGLIGIPAPNGLIPQAPMHTNSLVVMGFDDKKEDTESVTDLPSSDEKSLRRGRIERPIGVVEQRVSNLLQGSACLVRLLSYFAPNLATDRCCLEVLMTGPFLKLLHWVPKGVLAGLFVRFQAIQLCFQAYAFLSFLFNSG